MTQFFYVILGSIISIDMTLFYNKMKNRNNKLKKYHETLNDLLIQLKRKIRFDSINEDESIFYGVINRDIYNDENSYEETIKTQYDSIQEIKYSTQHIFDKLYKCFDFISNDLNKIIVYKDIHLNKLERKILFSPQEKGSTINNSLKIIRENIRSNNQYLSLGNSMFKHLKEIKDKKWSGKNVYDTLRNIELRARVYQNYGIVVPHYIHVNCVEKNAESIKMRFYMPKQMHFLDEQIEIGTITININPEVDITTMHDFLMFLKDNHVDFTDHYYFSRQIHKIDLFLDFIKHLKNTNNEYKIFELHNSDFFILKMFSLYAGFDINLTSKEFDHLTSLRETKSVILHSLKYIIGKQQKFDSAQIFENDSINETYFSFIEELSKYVSSIETMIKKSSSSKRLIFEYVKNYFAMYLDIDNFTYYKDMIHFK
jgi:hypothetical protein